MTINATSNPYYASDEGLTIAQEDPNGWKYRLGWYLASLALFGAGVLTIGCGIAAIGLTAIAPVVVGTILLSALAFKWLAGILFTIGLMTLGLGATTVYHAYNYVAGFAQTPQ